MTELFDRIGPLAALVASLDRPPALVAVAVLAVLLLVTSGLALGRRRRPAARWLVAGGGLAAAGLGVLLGLESELVAGRERGRTPDGGGEVAAERLVAEAVARTREEHGSRASAQQVAALIEAYRALATGRVDGGDANDAGAAAGAALEAAAATGGGGGAEAVFAAVEARADAAPGPGARREAAAAARHLGAVAAFDDAGRALAAYRRAVQLEPDDAAGWLGLGELLAQAGDAAEAERTFTQALDLTAGGADDPAAAMVALGRRGDLRMARGSLAAAEADYRAATAIARDLAGREPDSPERRRDLSLSLERTGDLLAAQGDASGALDAYDEALRLRRELAERAPPGGGDAAGRRELAVGHTKVGDLLAAQGDSEAALAAYREALRLAGEDGAATAGEDRDARGGAGDAWRGEVRVAAHGRIGDALAAAGDADGELAARRAAVRAAEALVAAAGGESAADGDARQRALAGALDRLGAALAERGDRDGALDALRRGLAAAERLAARDPDDAGAQTEAVAAYWRVAQVLADDPADRAEAAALLARGLAALGRLEDQSRLTAAQAGWIDLFKGRQSELLEIAADGVGDGAALDDGGEPQNGSASSPATGTRVVR